MIADSAYTATDSGWVCGSWPPSCCSPACSLWRCGRCVPLAGGPVRGAATSSHPAPSAPPDPRRTTVTTIAEGWAAHSARLAEELDACRVRCHVCGARVYVGETAA